MYRLIILVLCLSAVNLWGQEKVDKKPKSTPTQTMMLRSTTRDHVIYTRANPTRYRVHKRSIKSIQRNRHMVERRMQMHRHHAYKNGQIRRQQQQRAVRRRVIQQQQKRPNSPMNQQRRRMQ